VNDLTTLLAGATTLNQVFQNIKGILLGVATVAITIAVIIIGFKIMFAIRNGDNVRSAIQNMGVVAFAALLIGGAAGIASLLQTIGEQIAGKG